MSNLSAAEQALAVDLLKRSLIPLYVCLPSLTWVLLDYFHTLEDEIRYIWSQRWSMGKASYLWIRYYTIAAVVFDVVQIHSFARPGFVNNALCVAMDPTIRIVGAILLWSIELIMQLRIYALYDCSKRIATVNGILFILSVGFYLVLLSLNTQRRLSVIQNITALSPIGCPAIHTGIEWAQWIPPSVFEVILFVFAIAKTVSTRSDLLGTGAEVGLLGLLTRDHLIYFLCVTMILIVNNIMASGSSPIPWFSYAPFHAALGIMTSHLLMDLRKLTAYADSTQSTTQHNSAVENWLTRKVEFAPGRGISLSFGYPESDLESPLYSALSDVGDGMTFADRPKDEQWPDVLKVD